MRVNVYAEEMTERVEIISKEIDGHKFTGLRLYLELPATVNGKQYQAPFMHRPGDDDSSAVTFWGKKDLRVVLRKMLEMLDAHYAEKNPGAGQEGNRVSLSESDTPTQKPLAGPAQPTGADWQAARERVKGRYPFATAWELHHGWRIEVQTPTVDLGLGSGPDEPTAWQDADRRM